MIYLIENRNKATRVIHDINQMPVKILPGTTKQVDLSQETADRLLNHAGLLLTLTEFADMVPLTQDRAQPVKDAQPIDVSTSSRPVVIAGLFGIGDNLHQRALLRELMKTKEVWLQTCHVTMYHDLIEQGLKLNLRDTRLRAQARTLAAERHMFAQFPKAPHNAIRRAIGYRQPDIDRCGSICHTIMKNGGAQPVQFPDFSLPIPDTWHDKARTIVQSWNTGGKPIMIYRPLVQRREWDGTLRNADPDCYAKLFQAIRDSFFVVSIADIAPGLEWIVGQEQQVDLKCHHAEFDFPTLAALWSQADLVMSPAGFGPVLAQAVGTPIIAVYGGRESYRTTESAGAHLAPTLGIDPDKPCDCHLHNHSCARHKHITIQPAVERINDFLSRYVLDQPPKYQRGSVAPVRVIPTYDEAQEPKPESVSAKPKVLIYGSIYEDNGDRARLTDYWIKLNEKLNAECDLLVVDSVSPYQPSVPDRHPQFVRYQGQPARRMYYSFPDNIGHLSRRGRDGWGRAFSFGLQVAVECGYDFVAHIEGDSLFRIPMESVVQKMVDGNDQVLTTPVKGTKYDMKGWIETGLMIFRTDYVRKARIIEQYDWKKRKVSPTPEVVLANIFGKNATLMPWKAWRADKNQVDHKNIVQQNLDWITHCHSDKWAYDRFIESVLGEAAETGVEVASQSTRPVVSPARPLLKLNLGCGENRLSGWRNHDADVDITTRLPFEAGSASHILCEHCVEHVDYYQAIKFFEQCHRILSPDGVLRIVVPSIEMIMKSGTFEYFKFTTRWQKIGPTKRGAMNAILFAHGHKTAWTASLLEATLYYAGFDDVRQCEVHKSSDPVLRNVEGHAKIIGEDFNAIESCVFEARKVHTGATPIPRPSVAIVVGGADSVADDLDKAMKLCEQAGAVPIFFAINDQLPILDQKNVVGVTLHIDKLSSWLQERKKNGLPDLNEIWAHRPDTRHHKVTNHMPDLGGSSGLFATFVARKKDYPVILCGVPMTVEGGHFVRKVRWSSCHAFRDAWERQKQKLAPFVRSMSGWTKQQFGEPTIEWLEQVR